MISKLRKKAPFLQLFLILSYLIIGIEVFHSERSYRDYILLVLFNIVVDIFFGIIFYKKIRFSISPVIIATSIYVLCYSPVFEVYLLTAFLALISKALVVYNGRHFFNPSNFGITISILLLPGLIIGVKNTFSGIHNLAPYFFLIGLFNSYVSRTMMISLSFLGSSFIFQFIRGLIDTTVPYYVYLNSNFTPVLLIYAFHMINDPASTPSIRKNKIIFGISLGALYVVLSAFHITQSDFYALFILCLFGPFVRDLEKKLQKA